MRCVLLLTYCLLLLPATIAKTRADALVLEREGCYGSCPSYTITVFKDGRVTWRGKEFVRVKGRTHSRISKSVAATLFEDAHSVDFFRLQDSYYGRCVTDGPNENIVLIENGRLKRINTYCEAPAELYRLEDAIDEATNSIAWIFIEGPALEKLLTSKSLTMAKDGDTYMSGAIDWDRGDVVRVLARHGFRVDARKLNGENCLMIAVRAGKYEAAKALLEAGANPTLRDEQTQETPAINAGYREARMVKLFLDRHVPLDDGDRQGATMLMAAASQGHLDSVQLIRQAGADVNIRNKEGQTAIGVAEEYRDKYRKGMPTKDLDDVIDYLLSQGGLR